MKAIITKYALSTGIQVLDDCEETDRFLTPSIYAGNRCIHAPDWHKDKQSALDQVNVMRRRKTVSLKKQLAKLEDRHAKAIRAIEAADL